MDSRANLQMPDTVKRIADLGVPGGSREAKRPSRSLCPSHRHLLKPKIQPPTSLFSLHFKSLLPRPRAALRFPRKVSTPTCIAPSENVCCRSSKTIPYGPPTAIIGRLMVLATRLTTTTNTVSLLRTALFSSSAMNSTHTNILLPQVPTPVSTKTSIFGALSPPVTACHPSQPILVTSSGNQSQILYPRYLHHRLLACPSSTSTMRTPSPPTSS